MRTAEEILAQTLAEDYKKDMGEELPFGYNDYRKKTIISSMEEYAKEIAIAFAIDYAKSVLTWDNTKKPEDVGDDRLEVRYKMFLESQQEKSSLK